MLVDRYPLRPIWASQNIGTPRTWYAVPETSPRGGLWIGTAFVLKSWKGITNTRCTWQLPTISIQSIVLQGLICLQRSNLVAWAPPCLAYLGSTVIHLPLSTSSCISSSWLNAILYSRLYSGVTALWPIWMLNMWWLLVLSSARPGASTHRSLRVDFCYESVALKCKCTVCCRPDE